MNIQCIALDLDRTTLDAGGHLSPGNRQALERAIASGVHIVIASGRAFATLPKDVVSIPGLEYAITSNGAAVYHIPTGTCLRRCLLRPRSVEAILRLTAAEPVAYEAFVDGKAYGDADYIRDPVKYGASPRAVEYVRSTRHLEEDITGFIRSHIEELDSMDVIVRDGAMKERLSAILRENVPDIYLTSSVPQLIELSHRDAGKHAGVRFLTELLGLSPSAVAAFGDGDNDADMLACVGCGIAVANASPACLAAADRITGRHDEDGVAQGIYDILDL